MPRSIPERDFASQWTPAERTVIRHIAAHPGWWLMAAAFALLAAGVALTLFKHRRRVSAAQPAG